MHFILEPHAFSIHVEQIKERKRHHVRQCQKKTKNRWLLLDDPRPRCSECFLTDTFCAWDKKWVEFGLTGKRLLIDSQGPTFLSYWVSGGEVVI